MSYFKFYVRFDLQPKIFDILIEEFFNNFNQNISNSQNFNKTDLDKNKENYYSQNNFNNLSNSNTNFNANSSRFLNTVKIGHNSTSSSLIKIYSESQPQINSNLKENSIRFNNTITTYCESQSKEKIIENYQKNNIITFKENKELKKKKEKENETNYLLLDKSKNITLPFEYNLSNIHLYKSYDYTKVKKTSDLPLLNINIKIKEKKQKIKKTNKANHLFLCDDNNQEKEIPQMLSPNILKENMFFSFQVLNM